jgi:acyl carrier protein
MLKEQVRQEDVQGWLVDWFAAKEKIGKDTFAKESGSASESAYALDYFEAGWLTSMEAVEFVMEIEQKFDIQFSENDLQDARFVTLAGLAELILERSPETSARL